MESNARLVTTTNGVTALVPDIKKFFAEKTFVEFGKKHGKIQTTKEVDITAKEALCRTYGLTAEGSIFVQKKEEKKLAGGGCCPDCGAPIVMMEGCMSCQSQCGYSKCS
jgi:hypothetical protein